VISKYIRQIYKKKYLYSDDIRMYRGTKIAIKPVEGLRVYIDGDITDIPTDELKIQIFSRRIRVLQRDSGRS
jgi:diacylglycerol kinase family enzyme